MKDCAGRNVRTSFFRFSVLPFNDISQNITKIKYFGIFIAKYSDIKSE